MTAWIYHPTLDAYAEVPESAVGMHAMSGWVQQDPPPVEDEETEETPAAEGDVDALRALAEELGIKVDGRWGADRLQAEIDAASTTEEASEE
jgi:hypothetical protein